MKIRIAFYVFVSLAVTGCVTVRTQPITMGALEGEKYETSRTYAATVDQTWEAVVDVMQRYPITTIEKASGLLITDWVDGASEIFYAEYVGKREMLKDRTKLNIKVSQVTGGIRVTVNQYVKLFAPASSVIAVMEDPIAGTTVPYPPVYEWRDVSGIKDLPTRTSSKQEREILDAVEAKLKEHSEGTR